MRTKARFFSLIVFIFFLQTVLVSVAAAATRIMPLGDSITYDNYIGDERPIGERIAYRYRLWQLLTSAHYDFDFVGSREAGEDVLPDPDNEGLDYKLADITAFGPQVTQTYLSEVLRQKIAELSMPMPEPQSDNPRAPHYAPTMWQPRDIPI